MTIDLDEMERVAREATPGDLSTAEQRLGPDMFVCPVCDGEGDVPGAIHNNIDGVAMGVQFFGVGHEFGKYEAFFRAANPEAVLSLITRIRELEAGLDEIRDGMVASRDDISVEDWIEIARTLLTEGNS